MGRYHFPAINNTYDVCIIDRHNCAPHSGVPVPTQYVPSFGYDPFSYADCFMALHVWEKFILIASGTSVRRSVTAIQKLLIKCFVRNQMHSSCSDVCTPSPFTTLHMGFHVCFYGNGHQCGKWCIPKFSSAWTFAKFSYIITHTDWNTHRQPLLIELKSSWMLKFPVGKGRRVKPQEKNWWDCQCKIT